MSKMIQHLDYIGASVLVGLVAVYNFTAGLAQQSVDFAPTDFLGPMAALALSITGIFVLGKVLRYLYDRLMQSMQDQIKAKDEVISSLRSDMATIRAERDALLRDLLEDETPRPARRRAS